jgi:DNA-binding FadR family transcriptional regulator
VTIELNSELLSYLADNGCQRGDRLPTIPELAQTLGISSGKLREQLEVAREMGLVDVRPKTGIRLKGYDFFPMLRANLLFGLAMDSSLFEQYSMLRNHVEAAFFHRAVASLEPADVQELRALVEQAWDKLQGAPVQIPHDEHRQLHLTIYKRLDNLYVQGLLKAYWEAYEAVGLDLYTDYSYLEQVWTYHQQMVEAIAAGELDTAHHLLVEHTELIHRRPGSNEHSATAAQAVGAARS